MSVEKSTLIALVMGLAEGRANVHARVVERAELERIAALGR
jgi:hypothetical protein